ncbi:heparan-alpha-glucosaminide N-acetyltransferase domain-containing protein [Stenotrophomonas maltophilia]|nr:heparan-alpha-glucosaminide N-acetyltransferase domain-containing protein [Stenotrophomonas maltophilia]
MSAVDRRLHGLDLARYLALAGMVLVNFRLAMAVPAEGAGWLAGFFHFLEGKASATFVTLAGLGLVLATQRQGGGRPACRPGGARCS